MAWKDATARALAEAGEPEPGDPRRAETEQT
jgi:hypothetical protein